MRFVVVGDAEEILFLLQAVHGSGTHRLTAACVGESLRVGMTTAGITCRMEASAEETIQSTDADVLIVAERHADRSVSQVRMGSQAGLHVLALPPDDVSSAYCYELHLLLDESQFGLLLLTGHWFSESGVRETLSTRLHAQPMSDTGGSTLIRQVSVEATLSAIPEVQRQRELSAIDAVCSVCRTLTDVSAADGTALDATPGTAEPISAANTSRRVQRGVFSQVTALDVPGVDDLPLSRTITLSASAGLPPAVICFRQDVSSDSRMRIRLESPDSVVAELSVLSPKESTTGTASPSDAREFRANDLPDRIAAALTDRSRNQRLMEWFEDSVELLAAVEQSRRRRRTVDVWFEGLSERAAFKTQMTAIGCGILFYVMFGMMAFLLVAQLADLSPTALKIGRILWITPVVLFLLAQLLLPLARPGHANPAQYPQEHNTEETTSHGAH
ncbi:MAG: hypothetical protein KDA89_12760 [Planctomycetaceae bacterium]|nr:hypothetical protein [Planctomycetaceae bacterium]